MFGQIDLMLWYDQPAKILAMLSSASAIVLDYERS